LSFLERIFKSGCKDIASVHFTKSRPEYF